MEIFIVQRNMVSCGHIPPHFLSYIVYSYIVAKFSETGAKFHL